MVVWMYAILGGVLIGTASALLLLTHGRIAGISGIAGGILQASGDNAWRIAFLGGLAATGVIARFVAPEAVGASVRSLPLVIVSGLLVGFGTRLGNGCTSGHGVCGVGRLSPTSLVAVAVFVAAGMATAMITGALS